MERHGTVRSALRRTVKVRHIRHVVRFGHGKQTLHRLGKAPFLALFKSDGYLIFPVALGRIVTRCPFDGNRIQRDVRMVSLRITQQDEPVVPGRGCKRFSLHRLLDGKGDLVVRRQDRV